MKKLNLVLLVVTLGLVLCSCISKRIIQEIEFTNSTEGSVKIMCQKPEDIITIENSRSAIVDISSTNIVKIAFSDSSQFYRYDLNDLDIKAATDKEKSGKSFLGKIYWVYPCTINSDKTLAFNRNDPNNGSGKLVLSPKDE